MTSATKATIKASINLFFSVAILVAITINFIVGMLDESAYHMATACFLMLLLIASQLAGLSRPNLNVYMNGSKPGDPFDELLRKHFPPSNKV